LGQQRPTQTQAEVLLRLGQQRPARTIVEVVLGLEQQRPTQTIAEVVIGAQGVIRLGSMIYSNKVYITTSSGVCQAHTRIQEQRVLGSNQKCGALGIRHNVYSDSDWSTRL
jgi:hypothetical protein